MKRKSAAAIAAAAVLTLAATGSEMDGFAVISDMEKNDKLERSELIWAQAEAMPELAVKASMVAAIMDDMRHGIFSEVYGMNQLKRQLFPDGKENTFPNLWYEFLMRIGDIAE